MAYRGMGRDTFFVWSACAQDGYSGNWYCQPAGAVGTPYLGYQCPFRPTSFTPRHEYGKRTAPGISPVNWDLANHRKGGMESHAVDVALPVTQTSYLYPLNNFCNRQGYGTYGTVNDGDVEVYTIRFRPMIKRGTTASGYTWPKALEQRVVYDYGTSDIYSPAVVESLSIRMQEDDPLEMTFGLIAGTCYEGTVLNQNHGTNIEVDPEAPFQARDGTVRWNGSTWPFQACNLSASHAVTPHRSLNSGTLIDAVTFGPTTGNGDLTVYLETQGDWDALEQNCRRGTFGTLTFHYVGTKTINGTADLNAEIHGTAYVDPLTCERPVSDDGALMSTIRFELVGADTDTPPLDITGSFYWPFSTSAVACG